VSTVRLLALLGSCAFTMLAAAMLAPLVIYYDFYSAIIVGIGFVGLTVYTFDDLGWFFKQAVPRFLSPDHRTPLGAEQSLRAARIARTVGDHALLLGSICTLIGGIQMLRNLTDPSAIGPALAVAFLTNLYGIAIVAFCCFPMNRFFLADANTDGFDASDTMVGVYAQVLSSVMVLLPMGTIFLVMG